MLDVDETRVTSLVISELEVCLAKVSPESLKEAVGEIIAAKRVFLAGAGRSALGIRGFAMRLMHTGKTTYLVGETTTPGIGAGDLLVIGSGSGRTASLHSMAKTAQGAGARILLVTIDPSSPIGQLADRVIEIPTPSPKVVGAETKGRSIQPMGSLFEQSLFILLDCLVLLIMKEENLTSEEMFTRHANME